MAKRKTKAKRKFNKRQNKITPYPFPKTQLAKLRYVEEVSLNIGQPGLLVNGIAFHSVRANGCFDPNHTGIGHQPRGWDQYTALYNKYVVVGSRLTFAPQNVSNVGAAGDDRPRYYGVIRRNESEDPLNGTTNIGDIMETKEGRYGLMPTPNQGMPRKMVMNYSHKKEFNTKPTEHLHQVDTDPHGTEGIRFDCYIIPNATSDLNSGPIPCIVTIEYLVLFTDSKHLAQS